MKDIINFLTISISVLGAAIIAYGAILSAYFFIKDLLKKYHNTATFNIDHIRLFFGRHIILGLEFFIAGDIIETIFVPTYQEMGLLAGLVVLRTILSVFLNREMQKLNEADRKKLK